MHPKHRQHWEHERDNASSEHSRILAEGVILLFEDLERMHSIVRHLAKRLSIDEKVLHSLFPRVVRLTLVATSADTAEDQGDSMAKLITAVAVWSDGFTGFDTGLHNQPADWNVVFADADGGTLSNNTVDTVTLDQGAETADHVTGTYTSADNTVSGTATGEVDVANPPPAAKIASLNLTVSDV